MIKVNWKVISKVLEKHGPSILSWAAVGGVLLTGYLTHKATMKTLAKTTEAVLFEEETKKPTIDICKEQTKKNWKNYIPPVIAGVGTAACIIGANYWHLSKEGALTAAVAFYKASEEEIKTAIKEKYGDESLEEIKKDIARKKMEDDRPPWEIKEPGKMDIYEPYTKQWFRASQQEILWAELTANKMLQQNWTVTLNDILSLYPGCKKTQLGKTIGWSLNDESFMECLQYSYSAPNAAWITLVPQTIENPDGTTYFQMEYEIHPNDITEVLKFEDKL